MIIRIQIPVHTDGRLSRQETGELRRHVEAALANMIDPLRTEFDKSPRMLGTTCRFAFGEIVADVDTESDKVDRSADSFVL